MSNVSIVVGSWGSYNECNDRALGSNWLDLSDYDDWEEIEQELIREGYQLNGIDEELFIQDIEGIPSNSCNWDNMHPKTLFELLQEANVIDDDNKYELLTAFLEVRTFEDFEHLVRDYGSHWDDDIHLYKDYDWTDYGKEMFDCCGYQIPEQLEQFIDFEAYGKYMGDYYAEEVSNGIIEIIR